MTGWYVLDADHAVRQADLAEGSRFFATADRRVARDVIGDTEVSTVFLGLDHSFGSGPPRLFETMIFGGQQAGMAWRYATWDDAAAGHERIVAALRADQVPEG